VHGDEGYRHIGQQLAVPGEACVRSGQNTESWHGGELRHFGPEAPFDESTMRLHHCAIAETRFRALVEGLQTVIILTAKGMAPHRGWARCSGKLLFLFTKNCKITVEADGAWLDEKTELVIESDDQRNPGDKSRATINLVEGKAELRLQPQQLSFQYSMSPVVPHDDLHRSSPPTLLSSQLIFRLEYTG
jgi:hypothetical protein